MIKAKLIYSITELFTTFLKSGEKFVIPDYQRGYKWKKSDIEQLLDDICGFNNTEDSDRFYCLQNITLVKSDKGYNVVDGQQRLTTLCILLSYFGEGSLFNGKLEYDVRSESQNFITEYISTGNIHQFANNKGQSELLDWNSLTVDEQYDYQDIAYMYTAWKTAEEWFQRHPGLLQTMKDKISHHTKLIVNLPQIKVDEEMQLFGNLNGKRVPLDGADLVRAMIITRLARHNTEEITDTVKRNVLLNEQRVKTGMILDAINNWWSDKEHADYFHYFIRNIKSEDENVMFDEAKYPIDSLYKLLVQTDEGQNALKSMKVEDKSRINSQGSGTIRLSYFENDVDVDKLFAAIVNLQRLVESWYNDVTLYHLVLYVAHYGTRDNNNSPATFHFLTSLWSKRGNMTEFVEQLKICIDQPVVADLLQRGKATDSSEAGNDQDWYGEYDVTPVMVLLDVIQIIESQNNHPLAPLRPAYFTANKEDIEHIFPQTPVGAGCTLDTMDAYVDIAYNVKQQLGHKPGHKDDVKKYIETHWDNMHAGDNWERYSMLANSILKKLIPINSIGNLCLLPGKVNRSYGNDFFTEKYFDIIHKASENIYIRPHVLQAFTKSYASDDERDNFDFMRTWSRHDIIARRDYITSIIADFLKLKNNRDDEQDDDEEYYDE